MQQAFAHAQHTAGFHPAIRAKFVPEACPSEQRTGRRARAHWPVRLIGAAGAIVSGWVCDVSEGGFGLTSQANVPIGSILETALAVPHPKDCRRSLTVRAKVRVTSSSFCGEESRLGVHFIALSTEARLAIRKYALAHS